MLPFFQSPEKTASKKKSFFYPSDGSRVRAMEIVNQSKITIIPARRIFSVESSTMAGVFYDVKLFNNGRWSPSCTCEATTTCCHILAAMYVIRCEKLSEKKPNIGLTRMKSRKRPYPSGKKKPCRLDEPKKKVSRPKKTCERQSQDDKLIKKDESGQLVCIVKSPSPMSTKQKVKINNCVYRFTIMCLGRILILLFISNFRTRF